MIRKSIAVIAAAALIMAGAGAYGAGSEERLVDKGIIDGYEDGELHLERTLTRAEFTKMFVLAFLDDSSESIKEAEFTDIKGHWAEEYISKAVSSGVIDGFEDGTFRPDDTLTYEQAVKMIIEKIGSRYNYDYPTDYVSEAVDKGISDGVSALIGQELTRGEVVILIDNALEHADEFEEENYDYYGYRSFGGGGGGAAIKTGSALANDAMAVEEAGMPAIEPEYYNGYYQDFNTEEYTSSDENIFKNALLSPLSTFSIDTDTASYSNMRRFVLKQGRLPVSGSMRSEELINYFDYDNPMPKDGEVFSVATEAAVCPWNEGNKLVKISVQGAELEQKKPSNLVFLVDVSGSMYSYDKLPLVKSSLKLLLNELEDTDTVSLVTYASGTKVVLESTPVSEKEKIVSALDELVASGGTYGEAGINLAYEQAEKNLIDGNNRIIICTDGDFNIGNSSTAELDKMISEKRDKGIFLTVLGFGMGNYKDNRMETLADKGNGSYAYIDSIREAKKIFVDEMPKTMYTIAKDVKIQVEFNPEKVGEYRLIGYENRVMNSEDFDNDAKDAGELGSGAAVTALYEIVPAGENSSQTLKYQTGTTTGSDELMTIKLRYKDPDGDESKLIEVPVEDKLAEQTSADFNLAASVAELGMILNNSGYKGTSDYNSVIELAREGIGEDRFGFRTEYLHLVDIIRCLGK